MELDVDYLFILSIVSASIKHCHSCYKKALDL